MTTPLLIILIMLAVFLAALLSIDNTLAIIENDEIGDSNQTCDETIEELQNIQNNAII